MYIHHLNVPEGITLCYLNLVKNSPKAKKSLRIYIVFTLIKSATAPENIAWKIEIVELSEWGNEMK